MKFTTLLLALGLSAATAHASIGHGDGALVSRHNHHAVLKRQAADSEKKGRRRCRARDPAAALIASSTTKPATTSKPASSTTTPKPSSTSKPTSQAPKPTTNNNNNFSGGGGGGRTTTATSACGGMRAEANPSKFSGPNGHIDVLNCGIEGGGWNPPRLTLQNIVYKSLGEALAMANSPFNNCRQYIHLFEKYGRETGIPPIMIASIAMQESSCRANTVGGGGEQGLMQITRDKCGGAPGGDCQNPDFNIRTGARYLAGRIQATGGNVALAVGQYNGWREGLTVAAATRARNSNCCRCQNNLDYIHQFFNGWCQGVDAYARNMKKYDNLAVCG